MKYHMSGEEYEILYKRYLKRSPVEMLEMAGMKKGMSVLDLCSGANGRASKAAIEMGASYVCAVDENIHVQRLGKHNIDVFCGTLKQFVNHLKLYKLYKGDKESKIYPSVKFDIVICQQAINYWIKSGDSILQDLPLLMNRNGKFIFNTFNTCPPNKPIVKQYEIDGRNYVEVSHAHCQYPIHIDDAEYTDGDFVVCHIQATEGIPPHYTEFSWVSKKTFREYLSWWDISVKTDGNTDIYLCSLPKFDDEKEKEMQ